jgi:hypothetical protein
MTDRIADGSPWPSARAIGIVYLLYFLTAIAAVMLANGIVVSGDAAATAANILAHERNLGILMVLAGIGWLTFLWPPFAQRVSLFIDVLGFIAELALMIWLLVRGVNVQRWNELARAGWNI